MQQTCTKNISKKKQTIRAIVYYTATKKIQSNFHATMEKETIHRTQPLSDNPVRENTGEERQKNISNYELTDKEKKEVRKAYYSQQLNTYLDKQAASGDFGEDKARAVYKELERLEKERTELHKEISTFDIAKKIALPQVQELMRLEDGQKQAIEAWEKQTEGKYQEARKIFAQAKNSDIRGNIDRYIQYGFELAELQYDLDVYRVWKDQLYRAKLVYFMDTYGISRAQAEERAKITQEYRDYKKAVLFRDLVEEFIMLCKKKYSMHT